MIIKYSIAAILLFECCLCCNSGFAFDEKVQDNDTAVKQDDKTENKETDDDKSKTANGKPAELDMVKAMAGVWDAEFVVWSQGLDAPPMKFTGVETNKAFGEYWISSDLDTDVFGQTMTVHSIVGYDLDTKKMAGTIIDYGPYAAKMVGDYNPETKTVNWTTKVKDPNGKLIVQKTSIKQINENERSLILLTQGKANGEFNKFMQIKYTKRK